MQLQQPFNAQAVDPSQGGFSQLPIGKYPVVITASEIKGTADGNGGMLVFELLAIPGSEHAGATGFHRLNLYHANEKPRQIAESQLSALCHVTGVFMVQDTSQLHNIPFVVEVKAQPLTQSQIDKQAAGETVTPFTQVHKVFDMNGNEPGRAAGQPAPAPAPQQQYAAAPAPAPAAQGGWGAPPPAAAPAPAPAPAPAAGGWSQQAAPAAGAQPAWGKR